MRVAVLPVKFGYTAVALPPFDGTWKIAAPKLLPKDLLIQLRGQIAHRLAGYCWELAPWTGISLIAFLWALWGGLALGLSSLWDYGFRTAVLYGWVRVFFFGSGIMLLCRCIYHWRGLRLARLIRNHLLDGEWELDNDLRIPTASTQPITLSEKEFVEYMMSGWPHLAPWYEQLLKIEKPLVFRYRPLGAAGYLQRLFLGPHIPVPPLVFEVGSL